MSTQQVLYIRTDTALIDALDDVVRREREANPGRRVSRSDVAREMLWAGCRGAGIVAGTPECPVIEYGAGILPGHSEYLPLVTSGTSCGKSAVNGWLCTRESGHEGDHAAHGGSGYMVARWSDDG